MWRYLRIYWAYLRISFAIQLQYRIAMAIWMLGSVVQPAIYLVVWATVVRTQGGSVGGLTVADFSAYYITLMFVEHLTFTWIMWEWDWRIRQGNLSRMLLLPIHPVHADITDNLAFKLLGLLILVPGALALAWTFRPAFTFRLDAALLFIPVLVLAFLLRFMLGYALGMLAFWIERVYALNSIYFVLALFFSGRLTPLELLPGPLQTLANVLPFKWFTAFPVELLLGRLTPQAGLQGSLVQLGWLVAIGALFQLTWRQGIRRYSAYGA